MGLVLLARQEQGIYQIVVEARCIASLRIYHNLFFKFSLTPFSHSSFRILRTMESRRLPSSSHIWLLNIPSGLQPILFIAAILRSFRASALNSTRYMLMSSNAKRSSKNLQCLFKPVPLNFSPYQVYPSCSMLF